MKEREYLQMRAKIKAEFEAKLAALDTTWQMFKPSANDPNNSPVKKGQLAKLVGDATDKQIRQFTADDIVSEISRFNPGIQIKRASISTVLKRMEKEHKLEIVEQGLGRAATVFKNAKPSIAVGQ
jgi:hypothetical protein